MSIQYAHTMSTCKLTEYLNEQTDTNENTIKLH